MNSSDLEQDPVLAERLRLDDRAGPAPRISRDRAAAMIEQALASMPAAPVTDEVPARRGRALWQTVAIAAGVLLMLTGGAALARYAYQRWVASDTAAKVQAPTAVPSAPVVPKQTVVPQPPAEAVVPAAEPVSGTETVSGSGAGAVRREREPIAPEDLLQKANRQRSVGEFADAAATYSQVYEREPRSLSAYVAEVAAASIELEHLAHPARARKLFERALRSHPDGALDLEARQGLALSLRDLGDARAETAALQALIERHPKSPAAKRAALRLRELGAAD